MCATSSALVTSSGRRNALLWSRREAARALRANLPAGDGAIKRFEKPISTSAMASSYGTFDGMGGMLSPAPWTKRAAFANGPTRVPLTRTLVRSDDRVCRGIGWGSNSRPHQPGIPSQGRKARRSASLPGRPRGPIGTRSDSDLAGRKARTLCAVPTPSKGTYEASGRSEPTLPSNPSSTMHQSDDGASSADDLYTTLGIDDSVNRSSLSWDELHSAYLAAARSCHPDTMHGSQEAFDRISAAWKILGNEQLRRAYDSSGLVGVQAIQSVERRSNEMNMAFPDGVDGDQLDYLSETGQFATGLLTAGASETLDYVPAAKEFGELRKDEVLADTADTDACPRSVEEAISNITSHPDRSVRYYGLWWIYKFKVSEATDALISVLTKSNEQTSLGGYGLRRRAALAMGAVAPLSNDVLKPLGEALQSTDYYLRYRAAEAIASIALREQRNRKAFNKDPLQTTKAQDDESHLREPACAFPQAVLDAIVELLEDGAKRIEEEESTRSGYTTQEGLFDLDNLDAEVAAKLRKIFKDRQANEERSRRTTMTPQLGVESVDEDVDQPYEWLLKALGAIVSLDVECGVRCRSESGLICEKSDAQIAATLRVYLRHRFPLVRYAARKTLYIITGDEEHAMALVSGLGYGVEHHYSQRVLIRDLGDVGFCPAARAVTDCGMVENSFKILALKSMLATKNHDPDDLAVREVLSCMDSLL